MNQYLYRCTITWSGLQPVINGLLWVIVFILTSGVLPEEHVWMAKWVHSTPLNRILCCFYTLLCLISDTALQKPFYPNWIHRRCLLSIDVGPSCQCLAKLYPFAVSKIIHKSIHIFIVAAGAGFHIDSKNAEKDQDKSTRVKEKFGARVIIEENS